MAIASESCPWHERKLGYPLCKTLYEAEYMPDAPIPSILGQRIDDWKPKSRARITIAQLTEQGRS